MARDARLKIVIEGEDTTGKAVDSARGKLGKLTDGLAKLGGAAVLGGIAAAGAGILALGGFLATSVQEAIAAEEISAKLNNTLANTGDTTGVTAEMVDGLADKFSTLTKFEDDTIVAAEEVLARFDTISKDVFPEATEITLDLATALGVDAPQAAMLLGKALAVPGEGLAKLKAAGVTFTEAEEKQIDAMMRAGDTAGAQKLILDSLEGSIGGAAEAAGNTAAGKWTILRNIFGNVQETVGNALLPVLTQLADTLLSKLSDPNIQASIQNIATSIANFASGVIANIPVVIGWFRSIVTFLMEHQGIIIGILAAIGVAIAAFVYTTVIPAAVAMITALAPIVLPFLAIAAVVALLYEAWQNNWFGIRDILTNVWETKLKPIFDVLVAWLKENIPVAIKILKDFWDDVLKPAIERTWEFIQNSIFPLFQTLWNWLKTNLPPVLQGLANYWEFVLKPAIEAVWSFIQTYLFPLFMAINDFLGTVFKLTLTVLAGIWENVLKPALEAVWEFIKDKVIPIISDLVMWFEENLGPPLEWLASVVLAGLKRAFDDVREAIKWVIDKIKDLTDWLKKIKLPDWLQPGSPTPFELGLKGINDELDRMTNIGLPRLSGSLATAGAGRGDNITTYGGNNFYITTSMRYQDEQSLMDVIRQAQLIGRYT